MPKLPSYKFIYISTFLFLLVFGVATIYFLAQNGGLDFLTEDQKEQIVEESNVIDDPVSSTFGSCSHDQVPFLSVSKGAGQEDFSAKVVYANNESLTNSAETPIAAGETSIQIPIPEAKTASQQIYYKVVYTVDGKDISDEVQSLRLDPCNLEYKTIE